MRAGIDVGVDAQADASAAPVLARHLGQHAELGLALDVEAEHAGVERLAHLAARLADPREDHPRRVAAGDEDAIELAAGDDVEAAAGLGEGLQHCQRRIGLHRVADEVVAAGERALPAGRGVTHGAARIDVERRAVALGERAQRALLDVELAVAPGDEGGAGQRRDRRHGRSGAEAGRTGDAATGRGSRTGGCGIRVAAVGASPGRKSAPFCPQPASAPASRREQDRGGGTAPTPGPRYTRIARRRQHPISLPAAFHGPRPHPAHRQRLSRQDERGARRHREHGRPSAAGGRGRHRRPAHRRAARAGLSGRTAGSSSTRSPRCTSCGWRRARAASTSSTSTDAGSTPATGATSTTCCRPAPASRPGARCASRRPEPPSRAQPRLGTAVSRGARSRPRPRAPRQRLNMSRMLRFSSSSTAGSAGGRAGRSSSPRLETPPRPRTYSS